MSLREHFKTAKVVTPRGGLKMTVASLLAGVFLLGAQGVFGNDGEDSYWCNEEKSLKEWVKKYVSPNYPCDMEVELVRGYVRGVRCRGLDPRDYMGTGAEEKLKNLKNTSELLHETVVKIIDMNKFFVELECTGDDAPPNYYQRHD